MYIYIYIYIIVRHVFQLHNYNSTFIFHNDVFPDVSCYVSGYYLFHV